MILLFILLWASSAILLITDWRDESNRWLSLVTFFSGCGSLAVVLDEYVVPVINSYISSNAPLSVGVFNGIGFLSSMSHHLAPYALLIYGMSVAGRLKGKWNRWRNKIKLILLIPPLFMYYMFPIHLQYAPSFLILTLWVAPYVIGANLLLYLTFLKEKNPRIKQQKLFNCIIVSPITLYALFSNFILRIFGNHDAWRLHRWFIVFEFGFFVIFSIKYGALGVKIKLEKNQLERTRKSISSGTAIISHTIKNEIAKISMGAENIRIYCQEPNEQVKESLEIINESTNHLFAMVSRINEQMSDIVLDKSDNKIAEICDEALHMVNNSIKKKQVNVQRRYNDVEEEVYCDEVHIREVLINLLQNAIEAMENKGELLITLYKEKKGITLSIRDNGKGISKENLEKVLDPFFTTKKNTLNFGLGLSYCYNVMERHGGNLELISKEGNGTTVLLYFPRKKRWSRR